MAMPDGHGGQVVVILRPLNTSFERRLVLDETKPPVKIGRSNNREFPEAPDNPYFPCRVMSREHAELSADFNNKRLLIKDLSLHGTYISGNKLAKGILSLLESGDLLTFGLETVREGDTFPALSVSVLAEWKSSSPTIETTKDVETTALKKPSPIPWATRKDIFGEEVTANATTALPGPSQNLAPAENPKNTVTIDLTTNEQEISNPHQKAVSNFFDEEVEAEIDSSDSEESDDEGFYVSPVRRSSESSNLNADASATKTEALLYDPDKSLYTDSESEDDEDFDAHLSDMSNASSLESDDEVDSSDDEEPSDGELNEATDEDSSDAESDGDSDIPLAQSARHAVTISATLHPTPVTIDADLEDSEDDDFEVEAKSSALGDPMIYNSDYESQSSGEEECEHDLRPFQVTGLHSDLPKDFDFDEALDDVLESSGDDLSEFSDDEVSRKTKIDSAPAMDLEYDEDFNSFPRSGSKLIEGNQEDAVRLQAMPEPIVETPVIANEQGVARAAHSAPEEISVDLSSSGSRKPVPMVRPPSPSDAAMVKAVSTLSKGPQHPQAFDATWSDVVGDMKRNVANSVLDSVMSHISMDAMPPYRAFESVAYNGHLPRQPIVSSMLDRDGSRSILNDDFSMTQGAVRPPAGAFSPDRPNTSSTQQGKPVKKMSIQDLVEPQDNAVVSKRPSLKRKADDLFEEPSQSSSTGTGESSLQDAQVHATFPNPKSLLSQVEHPSPEIDTRKPCQTPAVEADTQDSLIEIAQDASGVEGTWDLTPAFDEAFAPSTTDVQQASAPPPKRARTEEKLDNTPKTVGMKRKAVNMSRTRYAAHALGWAAVGAVGVVTTLISLPADWFA